MTLVLTVAILEAAYEFVRATQPFSRWGLPEADEVGFHIDRHRARFGCFWVDRGTPQIAISERGVAHTNTLIRTMAHEMIHLHQWKACEATSAQHNAAFRQHARLVCKVHGWDPKAFV